MAKFDVSMLAPPPVKLSEEEAQALLDRMELTKADASIRRMVIATEEQRRQREAMLEMSQQTMGLVRALTPDDSTALAKFVAPIRINQRDYERGTRQYLADAIKSASSVRRDAERRSREYRATLVPLCDRYVATFADKTRYFRDTAIQFEALFDEVVIGDERLSETSEVIGDGVIRVAAFDTPFADLSASQTRRVLASLQRLATHPYAPQLQLNPIGVTAVMWIAMVDAPVAALLRREHGKDKDTLVLTRLTEFQSVQGDTLAALSGGAGWTLEDGELQITMAKTPESIDDWLNMMPPEPEGGIPEGFDGGAGAW